MKHARWMRHTLAVVATCVMLANAAHAAAPQVKTQAPGFHRVMLGDFEVTALSDGTVALPVDKLFTHTTAARSEKALARSFLNAPVETSVNGYLINTGTKLVLIDTDSRLAAIQRKRAYAEAAKQGYLVGSAHLSFPGLGHLRAEGKGYAWVPLNYSGLK